MLKSEVDYVWNEIDLDFAFVVELYEKEGTIEIIKGLLSWDTQIIIENR